MTVYDETITTTVQSLKSDVSIQCFSDSTLSCIRIWFQTMKLLYQHIIVASSDSWSEQTSTSSSDCVVLQWAEKMTADKKIQFFQTWKSRNDEWWRKRRADKIQMKRKNKCWKTSWFKRTLSIVKEMMSWEISN